jgi:hydroxyacylglutathione hydrolase
VTQIDESTYRITDATVYEYLLLGTEKALLIDTGMSQGKLGKILPQLTNLPITVINTHGHIDHVANNHLFEQVILSHLDETIFKEHTDLAFASALYGSLLDEMKIPKFIQNLSLVKNYVAKMATIPAKENREDLPESRMIDLGGRTLQIIETPGHTPGSICLLDVERKLLFSGDMVCDRGILLNLPHSTTVQVFQDSIKKLKTLADQGLYTTIYPAHHLVPLSLSFLDDYLVLSASLINKETVGEFVHSMLGDAYIAKYKSIAISYRDGNL